jgi:hypothetical protein
MTSLSEPTPAREQRLRRDEDGLIIGYPYKYTPDGRIDWRALVDRRFLFVIDTKRDAVTKAQGKPIDECDLSLVDERWLRIKQGGFNQLLNLRGYSRLEYHSLSATDTKAAVVCVIELIGNYETQGYPVVASAIASACTRSMNVQFMPYLETFAENRAFARCVKRALQLNILSEDEIDAEAVRGVTQSDEAAPEAARQGSSAKGYDILKDLCTNRKAPITFETLKARAIKHNAELPADKQDERIQKDPATWTDWSSIQDVDVWLLTGKIKEADEAAAKGKGRK